MTGIEWFPQEYSTEFFLVKGVIALISTLLLLLHMNRIWTRLAQQATRGQRLRYGTLLAFSVLVTGASAEQVTQDAAVSARNVGSLIVTVLLVITAIVSIREDPKS